VERWRFQQRKRTEEITVKKRIVPNALSVVRLAALAGQGIARIPGGYASADVARGKLVPVLESFWSPSVHVQLLYPTSRHLAPQVRAAWSCSWIGSPSDDCPSGWSMCSAEGHCADRSAER
jgi:DNA-binding transcriptional LysR family regulator